MKKIISIVVLLLLLCGMSYYFWRTYPYSEGSRTGYLVKLSRKGFLIKTLEGQLNLGGAENGMLEMWEFSIKDETVYEGLGALEGRKVKLTYEEVNSAFFWMGDTNYFVTGYELNQD